MEAHRNICAIQFALVFLLTLSMGCNRSLAGMDRNSAATITADAKSRQNEIKSKCQFIRQSGCPVTLDELNRWILVVSESENAAKQWTNAFAALVTNSISIPYFSADCPVHGALPIKERQALEQHVADNKICLELLHNASKYRKCNFISDFSPGFKTLLPHIEGAVFACQLLQAEALLGVETHNLESAVNSIETLFALARALQQGEVALQHYAAGKVLFVARRVSERMIDRNPMPSELLARLQAAFHESQKQMFLTRVLILERCLFLHAFQTQPNLLWSCVTGSNSPSSQTRINTPATGYTTFLENKDSELILVLETFERLIRASTLPYPQSLSSNLAVGNYIKEQHLYHPEASMIASTVLARLSSSLPTRFARIAALMGTGETAMAVERYRLDHKGQLPSDLVALIPEYISNVPQDPFDGQRLRFKSMRDRYVIYSVGSDGLDDGGRGALKDGSAVDETFEVIINRAIVDSDTSGSENSRKWDDLYSL